MSDRVNELVDAVQRGLRALADPVRAEGERRYFKGTINNLGVSLPRIQSLERQLCKDLADSCSTDDAMAACDTLVRMGVFEYTLFAFEFLNRFATRLGEPGFRRIEEWLKSDLCDNWAAVDSLCNHIVGTLVERCPHLAQHVKLWAGSENRWVRRASAVTFILPLRKGIYLDVAYEIAVVLIRDKSDDLVQKGNGWMLREAGTTDPDRLERFLLSHGPDIPRTTLRYAIEKYPAPKRSELLAATKR